ncbi:hypothetical protein FHX37_2551 [Haloactinospora alba]|uniref:SWIM-type domain-containing protein n=1 Tax=Haloactinospora alba TaxID=405555 RepID=A0A543NL87_9ACTN|nr:hypothetical protein [Haloactinospora alba]TQN32576.1 hypothetical protein FHX37_2551 [Haloactinospora alba]
MAAHAFSIDDIRAAAPTDAFDRGNKHHDDGRVRRLRADPGRVSALVEDGEDHAVRLRWETDTPSGACSCSAGAGWCDHAVALALAWLDGSDGDARTSAAAETPESPDLTGFLNSEDPTWLAEQLARVAGEDPVVWVRLAAASGSEAAVPAARDLLDEAVLGYRPGLPDGTPAGGEARLERAIGLLDELLDYGFADRVGELATDAAALHARRYPDASGDHAERLRKLAATAEELDQ